MDARRARRLAWSIWTLGIVLVVGAVVFFVLGRAAPDPAASFAFRGYGVLLTLSFATAGLLIASRVPSNPIGWILLAAGLGTAIQELAHQYAIYGVYDSPGAVPGADVGAWLEGWIWIPIMFGVAVCTPLLYPDGRLLSRRWRGVAILGAVGAAGGVIGFALTGQLTGFPDVGLPLGLEDAGWARSISWVVLALPVSMVGATASIVIRFRRSRGDERQQVKWLVLALSLLGVAFAAGFPVTLVTHGENEVVENLIVAGLVGIPVAIGVAILKYRLYDIDLVIRKTVVYAILAILLFAIGLPMAWALGGLAVWAVGGEDDAFALILAGLVVGILVWPLRRLATRIADRLVFGRRATPYEVLSEFSSRVGETYAADDVLERMAQVLGEAVGADAATVWLRVDAVFRPTATWPLDAAPESTIPDSAIEVSHRGNVLGAISARMPASDPMTPAKERLIRDLAGQAGLVLRNASLIEDLKASRQRLVAAQDEERRRIERNLHDGAQQQLVALAVKLGLAERLLSAEPDRVGAMLAEAKAETSEALETLRDLARGIYPPLLADEGLSAALAAQARRSPLPIRVESDGVERLPKEIEAAVYFCCLEALQNAAKHAGASSATVRFGRADGQITFEVIDDGRGFDPEAASRGTGLQGIADRLAALGGSFTVRSAPGRGTTLIGTIPVTEDAPR